MKHLIAQLANISGSVQEYIGHPPKPEGDTDSLEHGKMFNEDMEKRCMIARIVPLRSKITYNHNMFRGEVAWKSKDGKPGIMETLEQSSSCRCDTPYKKGEIKIIVSSMIPITESFSNEYGQSELSGMLQNQLAGGKLAEIARMSGAQNLMQFGQDIQNAAKGTPVEELVGLLGAGADSLHKGFINLKDTLKSSNNKTISAAGNILETAGEMIAHPWSKADFPMVWKNCSFQQQYEITTRLYCYNTYDDEAYGNQIVAPIMLMQQFVCPWSENGWLYTDPFMCDFSIYGSVYIPLAYISNLSVVKGGDVSDFSLTGRPNIVDLRFTVGSLYGVCVNTPLSNYTKNRYRPSIAIMGQSLFSARNLDASISPVYNKEGASNEFEGYIDNNTKNPLKYLKDPNFLQKYQKDIEAEQDRLDRAAQLMAEKSKELPERLKKAEEARIKDLKKIIESGNANDDAVRKAKAELDAILNREAERKAKAAQDAAKAKKEGENPPAPVTPPSPPAKAETPPTTDNQQPTQPNNQQPPAQQTTPEQQAALEANKKEQQRIKNSFSGRF